MNTRKTTVKLLAVSAALGLLLTGCDDGGKPGNNAVDVNDLQRQQETLTVQGYNLVQKNPNYKYTPPKNPLELQNNRKRLERFDDPNKIGYLYEFIQGSPNPIAFSVVKGKISSMGSSMTSPVGVVSATGGSVTVPIPGDDLSYGSEECEQQGIFWFDENDAIHEWCGIWSYEDQPVKYPSNVIALSGPVPR